VLPGGATWLSSQRVPARDVLHIYRKRRPGQLRDVSWLAPMLARLRDLGDYEAALLMKAKIEACLAAVVSEDARGLAPGHGQSRWTGEFSASTSGENSRSSYNRSARKTPENLPLSATAGLAESTARMGTGGPARAGCRWSPRRKAQRRLESSSHRCSSRFSNLTFSTRRRRREPQVSWGFAAMA